MNTLKNLNMAEYFRENPTQNVWNIAGYLKWTGTLSCERQHLLLKDNRARLAEVLGPKSGVYQGEFNYHNWVFENGFVVGTAKGKGTTIEVPPRTSLAKAIEFTEWLLKKIEPTQPQHETPNL